MNTILATSINEITSYMWKDERCNFEETYDVEFGLDNDAIMKHQFTDEQKKHIFYHVVQLQKSVES